MKFTQNVINGHRKLQSISFGVHRIIIGGLSFLSGVGGLFLLSDLPSFVELIILGVFSLVLSYFYPILRYLLIVFLGFLYAFIAVNSAASTNLSEKFSNKEIQITGVINEKPIIESHRTRFILKVVSSNYQTTPLNLQKIKLNWYQNSPKLTIGMQLTLTAKLKKPHGRFNNAGSDYEKWLLQNRFDATGYVRDKLPYTITKNPQTIITKFRQNIEDSFLRNTVNKPLLMGLLMGDRSQMSGQHWRILRNTGATHLLAISGLHLGIVVLGVMFLVRIPLVFFGNAYLALHSRYIAVIIGIIVSFFYALLAGFSVPTSRSFLMLLLFGLTFLYHKFTNKFNVLSIALVLCLLIDPFYVLSAGFWLSFLAVFWLLVFVKNHKGNWFTGIIWLQIILTLALMPTLNNFGFGVSIFAVPANIVALPIVSFIILPSLLLGFVLSYFPVGYWFLNIADTTLSGLWWFLRWLSDIPNALLHFSEPNIYQLIFGVISLFILLMPRKFPLKPIALLIFLTIFIPKNNAPKINDVKITVLDVGQGLSVLVETKSHQLLFDTGNKSYFGKESIFKQNIKPLMINKGISYFDKLIISHADKDHSGGFSDVLSDFSVGEILTATPKEFQSKQSNTEFCASQSWRWDGVIFNILHPKNNTNFKGNNASCVLQINTKKHSMLLLSDIEKHAEKSLIKNYPNLKTTVLLIPHHGSLTSSTEQLLQTLQAKFGIISSGYKNRFNHPHPKIITRLKNHHIQLFNTAYSGAVEILLSDKITIQTYRNRFGKFWHTMKKTDY